MSKNILLAVDTASHDPARHVSAAADMTRDLSLGTGDHVIVLHVHEFATGRFGRLQVDCGDGEGERVVAKIVSGLQEAASAPKARYERPTSVTSPLPSCTRPRITTRGSSCSAPAAGPTCPAFRWAAWPAGCCTRPPGRSSSCQD